MAVLVVVHGRVQGVGYRHWVVEQAGRLEVEGWVRNRRNGTVEMLLWGMSVAIEAMLERCRVGPAAARVDRIEVHDTADIGPHGFVLLPSA